MKNLFLFFAVLFCYSVGYSQLSVDAHADRTIIYSGSGDSVRLSAIIVSPGMPYNKYTFNTGQLDSSLYSNVSPVFNNPCGGSLNNNLYCWFDYTATPSVLPYQRLLETGNFNISSGNCYVNFDMKYGHLQTDYYCEDPDGIDEGVHLQYSTNTGQSWTDINYWTPFSNISGPLYSWNHYSESISVNSPTVKFRLAQYLNSGQEWDHWGVDELEISCHSQNVIVQWSHGPNAINPPLVYPTISTWYYVTVSDTISGFSSSDSVFVQVKNENLLNDLWGVTNFRGKFNIGRIYNINNTTQSPNDVFSFERPIRRAQF